MTGIKNINKAEVMALKDQVEYHDGQVVSKTLAQNDALSVTLFSFDKELYRCSSVFTLSSLFSD